ncbi:hypothetical protein pb186bvf_011252 [Paramecium bursaria]
MKSSRQIEKQSFSTQNTKRVKSEFPTLPNYDILNEHVKSSFALGFIRGVVQKPKTETHKTELQLKRDQTYGKANNKARNKRLTLLKFGFRTHEKKNNYYLQPLIRKVKEAFGDLAIDGSMGVVDLWSDRNVNRLMDAIEMTRDNLLLRRMGQERQQELENVILTRIEEKKLKDRIVMESLKMQQQETDTFQLKFQLTDKDKMRLQRYSKPTHSSSPNIANFSLLGDKIQEGDISHQNIIDQSKDKIRSLLENITEVHDENLEVYKEIYTKIRSLRKHIKYNK